MDGVVWSVVSTDKYSGSALHGRFLIRASGADDDTWQVPHPRHVRPAVTPMILLARIQYLPLQPSILSLLMLKFVRTHRRK